MASKKTDWLSIVPGKAAALTLDELRNIKEVHEFLTEPITGPAGIAEFIRGFRFLLFFGVATVEANKHPALTRAWRDLNKLFMSGSASLDPMFVQCWLLMDFVFGPEGQTVLDYFEEFLGTTDESKRFSPFIDEARRSRLGLYQDVLRTKKIGKFRELFTGRVVSVVPSIERYEKGEILLCRLMEADGQIFVFGDAPGFPEEAKQHLEDMIEDKFFVVIDEPGTKAQMYEKFMRLAGPYWMSCVTKDESVDILPPDQYQFYLEE